MEAIQSAVYAILVGVFGCIAYFYGAHYLVKYLLYSSRKVERKRPFFRTLSKLLNLLQPWIYILPALAFLTFYLIYPAFKTVILSFYDKNGEEFVGLYNYLWAIKDEEFAFAIRNNFLWLLVVPTVCTALGLVIAVLTDRLWWGMVARTIIFMPMAISFVGASVIWRFVYDYRGEEGVQIGLLNAVVQAMGFTPQAWITIPFWNNFFLMIILIWIQTGFAMVILGAALRGVPQDTIEAAIVDGAKSLQIFFKIMIPQIMPSIIVVWTTITILVLKVFDIVLTMTNGQWETDVLANQMFDWMFRGGGDFGRGSMMAVIIMVAVIPIMIWNIRRSRQQ